MDKTGTAISAPCTYYTSNSRRTSTGASSRFAQWLTAEGGYSDLIFEQGLLQDDDLQTETMVMPFHYTADQSLDLINGRKGEYTTRMKKEDYTTCRHANPCLCQVYSGRERTRTAS
ncbi:MAG TPA: hypothetical protein VLE70_04950 [Anaerolineae bacterium]|nr:hypothetical protein [Anaerolineae bacterium]